VVGWLQWAKDMINVVEKVLVYVDKVTGVTLCKGQVVVNKDIRPG